MTLHCEFSTADTGFGYDPHTVVSCSRPADQMIDGHELCDFHADLLQGDDEDDDT